MRRPDPHQERARELAVKAGLDPDARVPFPPHAPGYKPGRTMPVWCQFKAVAEEEERRVAMGDPHGVSSNSTMPLRGMGPSFFVNMRPDHPEENDNISKVAKTMFELVKVPTVVNAAVMPDACPTSPHMGEIPVGGVVATKEAIHPGMHSSDICCSMAVSVFEVGTDPKAILDMGMKVSHFGGGGRPHSHDMQPGNDLLAQFEDNPFLTNLTEAAIKHFGTQGDGNHFFFVGRMKSTDQVALVTHHGSRRPGAMLYKLGMDKAEGWRRKISPETPKFSAWIPSETKDGETYWNALQLVRTWTRKNHFTIHDAVAKHLNLKVKDRFWNEHNFVFRKTDGLFYHAKGATPAFPWWAGDATELTLIPLNMAEPILVTKGLNAANGLGFSPHGAGRYVSRSAFMRANGHLTEEELIRRQTKGIDSRYFCGVPDVSELPGAYKSAAIVRQQIKDFGLAEVVDEILPFGCIMAGDWQRHAPWRKKNEARKAARAARGELMKAARKAEDEAAIQDGLNEWQSREDG